MPEGILKCAESGSTGLQVLRQGDEAELWATG